MLAYAAVLYGAAASVGMEFEPSVVKRAEVVSGWVFEALTARTGRW